MAEWVYFLHPPRDDFAATMTPDEASAFKAHFEWLDSLFDEGSLVMVGVTGGVTNTGIGVFEAADEAEARAIVSKDPVALAGYARGELRPFDLGLLRGRNGVPHVR
jgi:uncharacterized protein YciI